MNQSPRPPDVGTGHPARAGGGVRRSPFFWLLIALSVAALGVAIWQWQSGQRVAADASRPNPPSRARMAPSFQLPAVDGEVVSLEGLRGRVVMVNFWASWCTPCRDEMPDLETLFQEMGAGGDFLVVGINFQETPEVVSEFAGQSKVTFPLLLDDSGEVTTQSYSVRTMPATFLIDRDGILRDSWVGRISLSAMRTRVQAVQ